MSTGAPTVQQTASSTTSTSMAQSGILDVPSMVDVPHEDPGTRMWEQVNEIITSSLGRGGLRQIEDRDTAIVAVAPGIAMSAVEYRERFGDIDLEQFRSRMSPEAFKVFVRYMGLIPGDPNLDVTQIAYMAE